MKERSNKTGEKSQVRSASHVVANTFNCPVCKEEHRIYYCKKLLDIPVATRINEIANLKLQKLFARQPQYQGVQILTMQEMQSTP